MTRSDVPRGAELDPDSRTFNRQDSDAVYALAQEPTQLGTKVKHALQVIQQAIERYSIHHLALSFNGGKDCTVLVHLLAAVLLHHSTGSPSAVLPPIPTIYVRQASPFPQEEHFTSLCSSRYHLSLSAVQGATMKDSLRTWIESRESRNEPRIKAVFVGTRRTDPHGHTLTAFDETDPTWPRFMRCHPILDWDYHQVWQFLRHPSLSLGGRGNGTIEWCELYDYGYTSIGSTHNTFPNPCLRRTPSTTPLASSISPSLSPSPSPTPRPPRSSTSLIEAVGSWLPAWELVDETQERAGREVSLVQVERKVDSIRDTVTREREERRELELDGEGTGRGNGRLVRRQGEEGERIRENGNC